MKKFAISIMLFCSLFSNYLIAAENTKDVNQEESITQSKNSETEDCIIPDNMTNENTYEEKEVPKAAQESSIAAEKTNWQPWAVAAVTIAVAATGIAIVLANK